jgi:hypothetical protein
VGSFSAVLILFGHSFPLLIRPTDALKMVLFEQVPINCATSIDCSAVLAASSSCQPGVEGPRSATHERKKDQREQHAQVGPTIVQYAPQSNFRKHDNLGRIQRDHDYTQKWKSRDPREQTEHNQSAARDFHGANEQAASDTQLYHYDNII